MKIKKIRNNTILPKYANGMEDTGADLFISNIKVKNKNGDVKELIGTESYAIAPFETILCGVGFCMAVPTGYDVQIRPTSGNSLKTPLRIPNSPATIDSGFRGEIAVIIQNVSDRWYDIKIGDKIAQLVVSKAEHCNFVEVNKLDESIRGENGYGSTGIAGEVKGEKEQEKEDNVTLMYNAGDSVIVKGCNKLQKIDSVICGKYYRIGSDRITDETIDHEKTLYYNSTTEEERGLLKIINKVYGWIAKDGDGEVWVFPEKPEPDKDVYDITDIYWVGLDPERIGDSTLFVDFKWDKLSPEKAVKIYR